MLFRSVQAHYRALPAMTGECLAFGKVTHMFAKNVGSVDRMLRILVGVVLIALFFLYPGAWWRYYALIGIVPLATGLLSTCPLYSILGVSTCPVKKN
jgi:hypothetical protein